MQKKPASSSLQIFPSILAGDFGQLAAEATRAEAAGADGLHVDIMDGHFVPNLTFGPQVVAALHRATSLFLDVHLMIYNPFDFVERFVQAGADRIFFHIEATEEVLETLQYIRKCGVEVGIALCPETSHEMVLKFLGAVDVLLMMTVKPGFGGQKFIPSVLDKIEALQFHAEKHRLPVKIEVDGGINPATAARCFKAGARLFVAGDYLYKASDMQQAISLLRSVQTSGEDLGPPA